MGKSVLDESEILHNHMIQSFTYEICQKPRYTATPKEITNSFLNKNIELSV